MEARKEAQYVPGICNIGPAEIKRRYRIGYFGLSMTLLIIVCVEAFRLPHTYRFLIFPALFYSLSGFIQARYKFCLLYGLLGVFSLTGRKHMQSIKEKEYRQMDRLTSVKIISLVMLCSGLLTLIYYFM